MLFQNKREKKRVRRMRVEKEEEVCASVGAWRNNVLITFIDYMGHRWFKYCDITATKIIHTVVYSLNTSQKHVTTPSYFSK
jgi:hypothetical protein